MKRYLYFILLVMPAAALPAQGGIFSKRLSVPAEQRVPELLYVVKTDADEGKRASAAAELREYDGKKFPDIAFILIDVMQNDTKPSVRREAAISLGRLRPIQPPAGQALQKTAAKDPSLRVRVQAWSSLKMYQLNGYSTRTPDPKAPAPNTAKVAPKSKPVQSGMAAPGTAQPVTTKEPPLAASPRVTAPQRPAKPVIIDVGSPAPKTSPSARPASQSAPSSPTAAPPTLIPPPVADGPVLVPQKP